MKYLLLFSLMTSSLLSLGASFTCRNNYGVGYDGIAGDGKEMQILVSNEMNIGCLDSYNEVMGTLRFSGLGAGLRFSLAKTIVIQCPFVDEVEDGDYLAIKAGASCLLGAECGIAVKSNRACFIGGVDLIGLGVGASIGKLSLERY